MQIETQGAGASFSASHKARHRLHANRRWPGVIILTAGQAMNSLRLYATFFA
jgi:hypothetical protein